MAKKETVKKNKLTVAELQDMLENVLGEVKMNKRHHENQIEVLREEYSANIKHLHNVHLDEIKQVKKDFQHELQSKYIGIEKFLIVNQNIQKQLDASLECNQALTIRILKTMNYLLTPWWSRDKTTLYDKPKVS